MGSIYFDASVGLYRSAVTLSGGKRKRVSARTRRAVAAKLQSLQAQLAAGLPVGDTSRVGPYLEWWLDTLEAVVLPIALFYGGFAQLLAGMWEFKKNNTLGALAFTSYGSFWLGFAAYVKFVAPGLPAAQAHEAAGLFLLAWTIFTGYMLIAALRTTRVIATVFAVLTVTFLLLTIGALGNHPIFTKAGGWFGLITAVVAWYGSIAGVTNATWGRTVLPTWPAAK